MAWVIEELATTPVFQPNSETTSVMLLTLFFRVSLPMGFGSGSHGGAAGSRIGHFVAGRVSFNHAYIPETLKTGGAVTIIDSC